MTSNVWFTRTQWAVGQGFFHSGEVWGLGNDLLHVYDCGSLDDAALDREIELFFTRHGRHIDMLFVSHYHYDHVSGLPNLLKNAKVDTVIIPVIAPIERLVALGTTMPADARERWAVDFAADPVQALRDLDPNVRVIQVEPDEEDPGDEDRPDDDSADLPEAETGSDGSENLQPPSNVHLRTGPTSALEGTDAAGQTVAVWEWKAYTTKFAQQRHACLLSHLAAQLGVEEGVVTAALASMASFRQFVQTHHAAITAAFDQTFADVNLSSLLLYSGPAVGRKLRGRSFRTRSHGRDGKEIGAWDVLPGWLGTGDQKMGIRRCGEVAKEFRHELWRVGVLTLPHHGAKSSYHPSLLAMFPREKPTCVVSAGVHSQYGHPYREVLMDVAAQGGSIVLVNEAEPSRSTESGHVFF